MNTFKTARLFLRKLTKEDVPLIQRLNGDPVVMQYIGPPDGSYESAKAYVDLRVDGYADRDGLGIFVAERLEDQVPIGWVCLKNLDDTTEIEIGYRLLKEYWGKGYATEGARCLLEHGLSTLQLSEVVAVTLPTNVPSQKVLLKLGLEEVGMAKYYGFDLMYFKRSK